MNRENILKLLLKKNNNKMTKTRKLNRNKRWVFENNRGLYFVFNSSNHKIQIRSSNIEYRNNGKRIVRVGNSRYRYNAPARSGGYRVPHRRFTQVKRHRRPY